jgi:hypothetical protein
MKENRQIRPEWVPEAYKGIDKLKVSNPTKIIHPIVADNTKASLRGTKQSLRKLRK